MELVDITYQALEHYQEIKNYKNVLKNSNAVNLKGDYKFD